MSASFKQKKECKTLFFFFSVRLLGLKEAEPSMCANNRAAQANVRSVHIDDEPLFHHSDSSRSSEQMVRESSYLLNKTLSLSPT